MSNDAEKFAEFFRPGYEKRIDISFNPSTNREVLNECQSHMNSNPPSKVSVSYQLVFTRVDDNSTVSEEVDLIGIRQQNPDSQWYDIFLYVHGIPTRLMFQAYDNDDSNATLIFILPSNIPSFDDEGIREFIASWGLE